MRIRILFIAALAVAGVATTSSAHAQDLPSAADTVVEGIDLAGSGWLDATIDSASAPDHRRHHHRLPVRVLFARAAEFLGLETGELRAELMAGKSVADVADELGADFDELVQAVLAPEAERLQERVDAGKLTPDQAELLLERMTDTVIRLFETAPPDRPL